MDNFAGGSAKESPEVVYITVLRTRLQVSSPAETTMPQRRLLVSEVFRVLARDGY
jgi:hypothetical protein